MNPATLLLLVALGFTAVGLGVGATSKRVPIPRGSRVLFTARSKGLGWTPGDAAVLRAIVEGSGHVLESIAFTPIRPQDPGYGSIISWVVTYNADDEVLLGTQRLEGGASLTVESIKFLNTGKVVRA